MKLLIDQGNTRLKWCLASENGDFTQTASLSNNDMSQQALIDQWRVLDQIESVWLASVSSSEKEHLVADVVDTLWKLGVNKAVVQVRFASIKNAYHNIEELGVDRWLAVIGARTLYPQGAVIVVDIGTAVTIDVLSADDDYLGGAILPGFTLMHNALVGATHGIKADFSTSTEIIGKTTEECVNSGVVFGLGGAVDRVLSDMQDKIDHSARVVLTGGGRQQLSEVMRTRVNLQPQLVFRGLYEVSKCAC